MRGEVTTLTTPTTSTGSFGFRCNICRWRYVHKSLNPAQNRWHSVFSDPSRNFDCFNNVTSQTLFHWLFRGLKLIQFNSFIRMRYAKKRRVVGRFDYQTHTRKILFLSFTCTCILFSFTARLLVIRDSFFDIVVRQYKFH